MKLSIIVPVYNEEKFVGEVLAAIDKTKFFAPVEVIVVNDGSKDNSLSIIAKFMKKNTKKQFILVDKPNGGKGSAIREGIKVASGDIIGIQDSDLEYPPAELARLMNLMHKENLPALYGTRFKNKNRWAIKSHYLGNRFLSIVFSSLFFNYIEDMETCYKVVRSKYLKPLSLRSNDFRIEVEITAKLIRQGVKIKEVPIKYYPRDYSEGKKINWVDGIAALAAILYFRFFD